MLNTDEVHEVAGLVAQTVAGAAVEVVCVIPKTGGQWGSPVVVAIGSPDRVRARPAEVLRAVLTAGGEAFILAHTHLSVAPPGVEDMAVTRRLVAASVVIGTPMIAHLVIGPPGVWDCVSGRFWPVELSSTG